MKALATPVSETERIIIASLRQAVFLFGRAGRLLICNQAANTLLTKTGLALANLTERGNALLELLNHFSGSKTKYQCHTVNWENAADPDSMPREIFVIGTNEKYQACWNSYLVAGEKRLMLQLHNGTEQFRSLIRKQALQEALYQTSRTLSVGEMAAVLAHELNQPLGAIINYLSSALKRLDKETQNDADRCRIQQALLQATTQAQQASAVIGRVREFVQSKEPIKSVCQPERIIQRVVELMQLEIEKHQIKVSLDISENLPQIYVDPVMLEQVLANLVRNAVDAMCLQPPVERKMWVSLKQSSDSKLFITVRDNGPGISPEVRGKLFAPFYTTKPNGMGAGLAICRSIIEFHGGRLYLEDSTHDDSPEVASNDNNSLKGACFVCVLPALSDPSLDESTARNKVYPQPEFGVVT